MIKMILFTFLLLIAITSRAQEENINPEKITIDVFEYRKNGELYGCGIFAQAVASDNERTATSHSTSLIYDKETNKLATMLKTSVITVFPNPKSYKVLSSWISMDIPISYVSREKLAKIFKIEADEKLSTASDVYFSSGYGEDRQSLLQTAPSSQFWKEAFIILSGNFKLGFQIKPDASDHIFRINKTVTELELRRNSNCLKELSKSINKNK
jgi:hypothetical protein